MSFLIDTDLLSLLERRQVPAKLNACVKAKDWHRVEKMGDLLAKTAYLTPWGAYYN